jgi:hypothetical protein
MSQGVSSCCHGLASPLIYTCCPTLHCSLPTLPDWATGKQKAESELKKGCGLAQKETLVIESFHVIQCRTALVCARLT